MSHLPALTAAEQADLPSRSQVRGSHPRSGVERSARPEDRMTTAPSSSPDPDTAPAPLSARAPVRTDSPAFSEFDVRPEIVEALAEVGIVRTFAIQELTLPIALAGRDLIGQARTGTGKTLGFGVPLLNRLQLPGPA